MPNDKEISQLISQSLRRMLNENESAVVENHLRENDEARKFAELSTLIQTSVSGTSMAEASDREDGLSQQSKQKLRDSIRGAVQEKLSLSQAGLLGPTVLVEKSDGARTLAPQPTGDRRQLQSRFRLIRKLGQGGLGNVWLAQDEKLNRTIAIKEMNAAALAAPDSWHRFHREAEITGHLEHPNVVPLYLYGTDSNTGEPFYAMRFVGKRTLANAIEEYHDRMEAGETGAVCLHRLLSVFLDICQAVAYAHSRGVVHRDLKPDNVALDNFGQVIVIDWGLAKVLEDGELATKLTSDALLSESALLQTMQGEAIGTPLYMSPEQAAGDLDKIDYRTDVYGLGAILFSILTGKAPHENSVAGKASDLVSVLKVIAASEPPSASDYGKCVPKELEQICLKAMARKQHMRFRSAENLASALESWMAGQNGNQAAYDALRMEGRELRADMQATARDMERNIRFAAGMPPIEQLMHAETDEDKKVWRERMAIIFQGLLKATPYFRSFAYTRIIDGQFTELVRVERHSSDSSSIRVVPRSLLKNGPVGNFLQRVTQQKPDEVYTSIVTDPYAEPEDRCPTDMSLLSGVPVYDSQSEDIFGCLLIDCDINQLLRRQMDRNSTADEIVVACTKSSSVALQSKAGQIVDTKSIKLVSDTSPHFVPAIEALQSDADFIDEQNADIFGASLWFVPHECGISYLLKRK
tara:strand:- start:42479 stop:44563 length:2085 start_codon:yes stop_codon:yes gene_type:complete